MLVDHLLPTLSEDLDNLCVLQTLGGEEPDDLGLVTMGLQKVLDVPGGRGGFVGVGVGQFVEFMNGGVGIKHLVGSFWLVVVDLVCLYQLTIHIL